MGNRWRKLLVGCLFVSQVGLSGTDDNHDTPIGNGLLGGRSQSSGTKEIRACGVQGEDLNALSRSESKEYSLIGEFLFSDACVPKQSDIQKAAVNAGVSFKDIKGVNLASLTKYKSPDASSLEELDIYLRKNIPTLIRNNEFSKKDLIKISAQLTLLSPEAAKKVFVQVMQKGLEENFDKWEASQGNGQAKVAAQSADELIKSGALEKEVQDLFSEEVQTKASLALSDSLKKTLVMLGVSSLQPKASDLAELFNGSVLALKKGIKASEYILTKPQKKGLWVASLDTLGIAVQNSDLFDVAVSDLHEAIKTFDELLAQSKIDKSDWRKIARILSQDPTLYALAYFFGKSLTIDTFLLSKPDKQLMMGALKNYSPLSQQMQGLWVKALEERRYYWLSGQIDRDSYISYVEDVLKPMVPMFFDLAQDEYLSLWLNTVKEGKMVTYDQVEKRYAKIAFNYLKDSGVRRDLSNNANVFYAFSNQFKNSWDLQANTIPLLTEWVRRKEQ